MRRTGCRANRSSTRISTRTGSKPGAIGTHGDEKAGHLRVGFARRRRRVRAVPSSTDAAGPRLAGISNAQGGLSPAHGVLRRQRVADGAGAGSVARRTGRDRVDGLEVLNLHIGPGRNLAVTVPLTIRVSGS